jgi:hypothetical protein
MTTSYSSASATEGLPASAKREIMLRRLHRRATPSSRWVIAILFGIFAFLSMEFAGHLTLALSASGPNETIQL